MTLEAIAIGLLALLIGLAFTFWGFRFFLILLPIWGFFADFIFGANTITYIFGDGFLATTLGWVTGAAVGIVFAVLSYLYYWVAVVFLGASVGYAAGMGVMHWLNNGGGLLAFMVALIGAIIGGAVVIILRVPKYLVLGLTAFGGAFAALCGVALVLGRVPLASLNGGTVGAYVHEQLSWIWVAAAIVLGVVGFVYQDRLTKQLTMVTMESYRNPRMPA